MAKRRNIKRHSKKQRKLKALPIKTRKALRGVNAYDITTDNLFCNAITQHDTISHCSCHTHRHGWSMDIWDKTALWYAISAYTTTLITHQSTRRNMTPHPITRSNNIHTPEGFSRAVNMSPRALLVFSLCRMSARMACWDARMSAAPVNERTRLVQHE